MKWLLTIYKGGGAIIGFLAIVLVFSMLGGDSITNKMILLVLFSILILNASEFIDLLKKAYPED